MAAVLVSSPRIQLVDENGEPLVGAKLYTYETLTSTPVATYSDAALTTPHANPIISDANGFFPAIYLDRDLGALKFRFFDADDVNLGIDTDPAYSPLGVADLGATSDEIAQLLNSLARTDAEVDAIVTPTDYSYGELVLSRYSIVDTSALTEAASVASEYSHARIIVDRDIALTSNVSIPANATLVFDKGAVITPATNITLTILGSIEAGPRPIFDLSASGSLIAGPIKGRLLVEWWGAVGDGDGAGGGTNDATAIQKAFSHLVSYGGKLECASKIYRCNTALTIKNSASGHKELSKIVYGNGAQFDFSGSGLTSGALIEVGATDLPYISENQTTELRDIEIIGPEDPADVRTAPATTVIGLSALYAIGWSFINVRAQYCYKGFKSNFWWDGTWERGQVRNCYIGYHVDAATTVTTWVHPQSVQNTFAWLLQPNSGIAISSQTFITPRMETCDVGFIIDPASNNIHSILVLNPYCEDITYDFFRVGIQFNASFASITTRTERSDFVHNFQVIGGKNSDNVGYSSNHKPFVFNTWTAGTKGVSAPIIKGFPCDLSDIVGTPHGIEFTPGVGTFGVGGSEHYKSQELYSIGHGEIIATFAGATGTNTMLGNGSTLTRVGTGTYDIVPASAYANAGRIMASGTCDSGVVEVDTANTTTTNIRILTKDYAGTLKDPTQVRVHIKGALKPWT